MENLRRIMEESRCFLESMAETLAGQTLLPVNTIANAHIMLNKLEQEQIRFASEVAEKVGSSIEECCSIPRMEELLEAHARLSQRRLQEETVLRLVQCFESIIAEADYGFALEPAKEKLRAKNVGELLLMDEAGALDQYRMFLELVGKSDLTVEQVMPLKKEFGPLVMIGLLANEYAYAPDNADTSIEEIVHTGLIQEKTIQNNPAHGESVQEEYVTAEPTQEGNVEDGTSEGLFDSPPCIELATLVSKGCRKTPKTSVLLNKYRKSTRELGNAVRNVAYFIAEDWGCRKSVIHTRFARSHADSVIDSAIEWLQKEGFIDTYMLTDESEEDCFLNVTYNGYQILEKASVIRQLNGSRFLTGFPELKNAGVFARLRRMNDVYNSTMQDLTISRTLKSGFSGIKVNSQCEDVPTTLYLPMLYTDVDNEADYQDFLAYFLHGVDLTDGTHVILETHDAHKTYWMDRLRRDLPAECLYYVGTWDSDCYIDESGVFYALTDLLADYRRQPSPAEVAETSGVLMPDTDTKYRKKDKPEEAEERIQESTPEVASNHIEVGKPEKVEKVIDAPDAEAETDYDAELMPEDAEDITDAPDAEAETDYDEELMPEDMEDITDAPDAEAETDYDEESMPEDTEALEWPLPEADTVPVMVPKYNASNPVYIPPPEPKLEYVFEDNPQSDLDPECDIIKKLGDNPSVENAARVLLTTIGTRDMSQLNRKLIINLVRQGRNMEALVLARSLVGVCRNPYTKICYDDLLYATNLPLENRDYIQYLSSNIVDGDLFGTYCRISAAFWAACFPKEPYPNDLFNHIYTIESWMESILPAELFNVRRALKYITTDLKKLSFGNTGDGTMLSPAILEILTEDADQEKQRNNLMCAATEKLNAPRSNISITGLETLMRIMMGPNGDFGSCMKAIANNDTNAYTQVYMLFCQFTKDNGSISERLINRYIDDKWDMLRKAEKHITLRYFDNDSPARNTLLRELGKRLEIMDEWLRRNASQNVGSRIDIDAYKTAKGRLVKNMKEAERDIDAILPRVTDIASAAGMTLLRSTIKRIVSIINGGSGDAVQQSSSVFAGLLTTKYPLLDSNGEPLLDHTLNELSGMEPWRMMLNHIASEPSSLNDVLEQIEQYELKDHGRYEDYGSAVIIRSVLKLEHVDYSDAAGYALKACLADEDSFRGEVRLACAYGQITEETKETLFTQLARYRHFFIPKAESVSDESADTPHVYGNYAHFRMMLNCLRDQMQQEKATQKDACMKRYAGYVAENATGARTIMLQSIKNAIDAGNYATAEEYMNQFHAHMNVPLFQNSDTKEYNFHDKFIKEADWYCMECERADNKGRSPRAWGLRVLLMKNFWSASNERNSAESMLENWPYNKGSNNNARMIRQFLRLIGMDAVQQVYASKDHPVTNQYEVFVADIQPAESGKEDYPHPVAKLGTAQAHQMYIVCLYGCKGSATLIDIMTKKLQLGGNTLVLMDGVVNLLERRRVAAQFKIMTSGQNSFLLIDRVLMLYLAAQDSGNRFNAMLQCTLPYTYEQLYIQGPAQVADEMFMGRISERKSLCEMTGTCLVYGGRQLGKTALLRRVEHINHKPNGKRYAVFLEIKDEGSAVFIRRLKNKLMDLPTQAPLLRGDEEDLEAICDSLRRNHGLFETLTILIDEVDVYFEEIAPNNYSHIHPVVVLQEELPHKVKFVFAGTHNVAANDSANQKNGDLLKLRPPLCIKPLSPADATQLIRRPLSYLGFNIGEQQIALILANTNSYPGLIHLFCHALVESICNNYSQNQNASRKGPPYEISDEQLHTIFREKDIKKEISKRVMATIEVDDKYNIVSKILAFMSYQDQENGITRLFGYTPEEVQQCNMDEFRIPEFMPDGISVGDLDNLMHEMERMGILWKNVEKGSYRFRQRDFLGYIGSMTKVTSDLLGGIS